MIAAGLALVDPRGIDDIVGLEFEHHLGGDDPGGDEGGRGVLAEVGAGDHVVDGLLDLGVELLLGTLVLLDLHIPAHELGGEAGVLAAATDGLGELRLIDGDV